MFANIINLSFFQTAFLWALSFAGLILFLHLFRRKSTKRMDISTLRFFSASALSQSKAKKVRQLLLLISRLLLILVLVLIFAGLHDKRSSLTVLRDPQCVVYSWVDPAMSMEYKENGKTSAERAQYALDSLINALSPSVDHYHFDHEALSFSLAKERGVSKAAYSRFGPTTLEEAVNDFINASAFTPAAVFVMLSDFKTSTTTLFDSLTEKLAAANKSVVCVSVTPSKPWNYSVKTLNSGSSGNGISAVVQAQGADLDSSIIELVCDGLRIGQKKIVCAKEDSLIVTFEMPSGMLSSGSSGKIELHAADPLSFDNSAYFALEAAQGKTALIVGNTQRNKVIAAALKAAAPKFWKSIVLKEGGELSYEDINAADLVIVNSFSGSSRILTSFLSTSGIDKGILISLDPDSERDFGRDFLLHNGFSNVIPKVKTAEKGVHPVLSDKNSELWQGFPNISSANSNIYRYLNPIPGSALVRAGNLPLVSLMKNSKTEFVLLATPIGVTSSNNLCETGFFVPFIDRLSRYALKGSAQTQDEWYAGYLQRNPFFGTERTGALHDRDSKLISTWTTQPFVKVDKPGVYSLTSSTGETSVIAVSVHPSESEISFTRPILTNSEGIYYFKSEEFLEQIRSLANNVWSKWLWVSLGLALCCEALLFRRDNISELQKRKCN
ncbi:MAG: BatA domain-containing protein [Chitinispirillales bacterium]|jgi:hypothetical protein|nr:BatA domain-containing protein [Chitinispirillales bacterium]